MAAPCPFGVKGMDGAALDRCHGVFDKAGFVERVGVDHHLHIHLVRHRQAAVDGGGRGAPVFVQFQCAGPALDHLNQPFGARGVALARQAKVDGKRVQRLQHPAHVPRPGRAGGGQRAMCRPRAATQHRGDARMQRIFDLAGCYEMDMAVKATCRQDLAFTRDHLG